MQNIANKKKEIIFLNLFRCTRITQSSEPSFV